MQTLPTGVNQVTQGVDRSSASFAPLARSVQRPGENRGGRGEIGASQQDAASASVKAISGEIAAERAALAQKKSLYSELTKMKVMSAGQGLAATQAALNAEYHAEQSLLKEESQIAGLTLKQRQQVLNNMSKLDAKYAQDSQRVMTQSVEQMVAPMNKLVD